MSATYLIDGYNLIHFMGLLGHRAGPGVLEKTRLALLSLLKGSFDEAAGSVTVVFDAAKAPAGAEAALDYFGIQVRFAQGPQEADDLIEDLIRHAAAPKSLTVVSDDHRLHQAARQRQSRPLGCGDFLDWLAHQRRQSRCRPPPPEKADRVSAEETQRWLREFGDLEKDPEFKELFDKFGWSEP